MRHNEDWTMIHHTPGPLPRDPATLRAFILAGRAIFTVVNRATGGGFTYQVNKAKNIREEDLGFWFAKQMLPDQESRYLGVLDLREFKTTKASNPNRDNKPIFAFQWFWLRLLGDILHDDVDVIHQGKCGMCGRKLTNPESILRGIGPECWEKM